MRKILFSYMYQSGAGDIFRFHSFTILTEKRYECRGDVYDECLAEYQKITESATQLIPLSFSILDKEK
jgi:hypothetical protein